MVPAPQVKKFRFLRFRFHNTESKTTERLVLYLSDLSGGLEGNSAEVHKLESQTFFFVVESYCPTLGIRMGSVHNQYCTQSHECSVPRTVQSEIQESTMRFFHICCLGDVHGRNQLPVSKAGQCRTNP